MKIGVLGPLSLASDRPLRVPTAPKQRTVLGMLVVNADRYLPASALIRELWGETPPSTALTTLQTYILSLRKSLAAELDRTMPEIAKEVLVTESGGYRLDSSRIGIDLCDFRRLDRDGRAAFTRGDHETASTGLRAALQQWRGPALVDVPAGASLESARFQLEESRVVTTEYLVEVQLRLGMYGEVCTDLAPLVREYPLHEGLHTQYMRALCLRGCRAQALGVFHDLRARLVDELGLEPVQETRDVFQAILTSDPGRLDVAGPAADRIVGLEAVPRC